MIPTQTFASYPEFGNNSTKIQPENAKYSAGFLPSEVLPAEYLNWFLAGATGGVSDLNEGLLSVEQELNAILTSAGEIPNNTSGQVLNAIQYIINQKTGTLTNLQTTSKTNIVVAVNELLSALNTHKNDTSNPHQVGGSQLTEPVPTSKIEDGAVTSQKLAVGAVSEFAKLSSTMQNLLFPAGKIEHLSFVPNTEWLSSNRRLICDGSEVSRTEYPRLFSAIGVTYGAGDGTTTFTLPNYIGKMLFGSKTTVTEAGGNKTATLSSSNLPSHTHSMSHGHSGTTTDPVCLNQGGGYNCKLDTGFSINSKTVGLKINSYSGNTGSTGSGSSFSIMNPYNTAVPVITY